MNESIYAMVLSTAVLAGGCASPDVNPAAAEPGTGYVDFVVDDDSGLCWQIRRLEVSGEAATVDAPREGTRPTKRKGGIIFEEFRPRTNGIVRLAFAPGEYWLEISFLNRAITEPGAAHVLVEDGKVTPVRVTLLETGKTIMEKKDVSVGGTFYGRGGRSTKLRASEGATFRVEAEVGKPVPYHPKEAVVTSSVDRKSTGMDRCEYRGLREKDDQVPES